MSEVPLYLGVELLEQLVELVSLQADAPGLLLTRCGLPRSLPPGGSLRQSPGSLPREAVLLALLALLLGQQQQEGVRLPLPPALLPACRTARGRCILPSDCFRVQGAGFRV